MQKCCEEMTNLIKQMEHNLPQQIGHGEISGGIDFYGNELIISDGWNDAISIPFRYCPFCGKQREVK
jgi:hypothetical protein